MVRSLRVITIQNADGTTEEIQATDQHPFWVQPSAAGQAAGNVGAAGSLRAGDTLIDNDGHAATIVAIRDAAMPSGVAVYNLEVQGDHSYFVSQGDGSAVWVHNGINGNCRASRRPNHLYIITAAKGGVTQRVVKVGISCTKLVNGVSPRAMRQIVSRFSKDPLFKGMKLSAQVLNGVIANRARALDAEASAAELARQIGIRFSRHIRP